MELNQLAERLAEQHVKQSLAEMADASKRDRWENGERAKEQAEAIVSLFVAEAHKVFEQQENGNENQST